MSKKKVKKMSLTLFSFSKDDRHFKSHGQKYIDFVTGMEDKFTDIFSLRKCHGHFFGFTGIFLKIVTGAKKKNVTGKQNTGGFVMRYLETLF